MEYKIRDTNLFENKLINMENENEKKKRLCYLLQKTEKFKMLRRL